MSNIYMQVEYTEVIDERGKGRSLYLGDSGVFESRFTTVNEVFKDCQQEYGRCINKVYVGEKDPKQIGWVFQKRVKYTDCDETYLQEAWVTLHAAPAKKIVEYSPMYI